MSENRQEWLSRCEPLSPVLHVYELRASSESKGKADLLMSAMKSLVFPGFSES